MTTTAALDLEMLIEVLRSTHRTANVDVALGVADAGVPVLPTVPGDKGPMLAKDHTSTCDACRAAGLTWARDHGATTDPDTIRRYWAAHPDAGVGMKNHPNLVRGDADHDTAGELKASRKAIGYGQVNGEPEPFEAHTPGGMYRRRYLHTLPAGAQAPGGGTKVHGVAWYGDSGYVVVKGGHPTGPDYAAFLGEAITPLPESVTVALSYRRDSERGAAAELACNSREVDAFLAAHTACTRIEVLTPRQRAVVNARPNTRHDTLVAQLVLGFRDAVAGYVPARTVHDALRSAITQPRPDGSPGFDQARMDSEWVGCVAWAVAQVKNLSSAEAAAAINGSRYKLTATTLDNAYPREYIDHLDQCAPRDLLPDELDTLAGEQHASAKGRPTDASGFPQLTRIGELARIVDETPAQPDVVHGLLAAGDYGTIAAEKKFGKTWLAADLAVNVAGGGRFLGRFDVEQAGTVVLFAGEGGKRKIVRRTRAVAAFYGIDHDTLPLWVAERAPKLGNPVHLAMLDACLAEHRPVLTIIDPAYLAISGAETSNLAGVGEFLERAQHVAQARGSALMFMHHWNKTGTTTDADRITGAGFAEWSRIVGSGSIQSRQVDPVTKRSEIVAKLEWIGDEIPDTEIHYRRSVWVDGEPDDRNAPMRYEVRVIEQAELPPVTDPALQGLKPSARRVLDVLSGDAGTWMTKREIGDRLARDDAGFPLKGRTILDACKALTDAGLVEAFTGAAHNDPTSWQVAA